MNTKFKCIMCSIIVSAIATTSFGAEINKVKEINKVETTISICSADSKEVKSDNSQSKTDTKTVDGKDKNNSRGKVYVCKPFYLDHFGVIKSSLKKFGVSGEKLATYIREGKKLEDVLEIENIPVKKFKKEVIKQYNTRVKAGVKEGSLTKEQAKKLKQAINTTIKKWLN